MTKELLTIRFRYHEVPKNLNACEYAEKTITIGVYDTLEEAVKEGNNVLKQLSSKFKFSEAFGIHNGVFGCDTRLVCDCFRGCPEVFCKITQLKCDDICKVMDEVFESEEKYRKWREDN